MELQNQMYPTPLGTATVSYLRSKLTEEDLRETINKTGFTAKHQQQEDK